MESLPIHVFKNSFGPIIELLNQEDIQYSIPQVRSGVPMASSGVIEVLRSAAMWGALASVVIAFVRIRTSRKVIITTKDDTIIHAEGLTLEELKKVLRQAKSLTAIETKKDET